MELDLGLLDAVERYATGANVHRLREAAHIYVNQYHLGSKNGWSRKRIDTFQKYEQILRVVVRMHVRKVVYGPREFR